MMKRIDLIQTGGFTAGTHLVVNEVPVPTPLPDQVVIEVQVSSVNPIDWVQAVQGLYLPEKLPTALGCDVAGKVVAVGSELSAEAWLGQRVVTYLGASKSLHATNRGAFVQLVAMDADLVFVIPDHLSIAESVSIPVGGLTSGLLLEEMGPWPADQTNWILIWGASSSVGHFAVQMSSARGLNVIAVASSKHEDELLALGAKFVVDYHDVNVLGEQVRAIVKGSPDGYLNGGMTCVSTAQSFATTAQLVADLGDPTFEKVVSVTLGYGMPPPPAGVRMAPVDLASALDVPEKRAFCKDLLPILLKEMQPQPVHTLTGPWSAELVEQGLQMSKSGVSGEKLVLQWM